MAKKTHYKKEHLPTLSKKVPDALAYTVLIALFIVAVTLVKKMASFDIPTDIAGY